MFKHYLLPEVVEQTPWGFMFGPKEAKYSLGAIGGQHGNEYVGLRATGAVCSTLATWAQGKPATLDDGSGTKVPAPEGFAEMRILCAPLLNPEGFAMGTRKTHDRLDLNRHWPDRDPRTREVWDSIKYLPGRVHLVDIHGTWVNRDGDPGPDSHLFVAPECRELACQAFSSSFGEEIFVVSDPAQDAKDGILEGAALAAGHWAVTLELGEDDGRWVTRQAALFLHNLIQAILAS